jgi:alginate O-acetyltransferase complex protein AlgI
MVFSSLTFLYLFLPAVLISYYLTPVKYRNYPLLLASFVFYSWGGVSLTLLLLTSVIFNYVFGRLISKQIHSKGAKLMLSLGIIGNLSLLAFYKYANFIVENINTLLESVHITFSVTDPGIILPIGISFYTFQALSYLIDLYKQKVPVQKNFVNLALYISLFPQLIAGPIVRYNDIDTQLTSRKSTTDKFVSGIKRFILGLAKKVLIANQFALLADTAFQIQPENLSTFVAWAGIIAYSIQIYYDFSGYSDMAIGLGRMFGFEFLENFNFPYISRSIREFWKRWHISLTNWFRDYLYIPLGGNRKGNERTFLNLFIVFLLTGLWHGASWSFVAWGLLHGAFMIIEKIGFDKLLIRFWKPLQHAYALFIVIMAWVLFRADDFSYAWGYYKAMFSLRSIQLNYDVLDIFLNDQVYLLLIIAVISSTNIWVVIYDWLKKLTRSFNAIQIKILRVIVTLALLFFIFSIILLSSTSLISNTYNPFIYFRF